MCKSCKNCKLCETRTNVVCGVGCSDAKIMFVGEAPGKNEDSQGLPFVGAAGKKLDELLSLAGLSRDKVYITNLVKCRPPKNRNPRVAEIKACEKWLLAEIAEVRPSLIVTLGNFPTQYFLQTKEGITSLHGRAYEREVKCDKERNATTDTVLVYPVFHPAAVIYDQKKQAILEEDFRKINEMFNLL